MPVLQTGQSFASGNQVTATKLQDIANLATFRTGANNTADGSTIEVDATGGYLKVPSNGIGTNQLSSDASVDANRAVGTNHIKDGAVTAAKLDSAAVSVLMPTATVLPYAGSAAPTGYFLCDGSAKSRTTYAGLFAIIGTTYGVGDGSTTFNIPDLRGRVIAGQDDMGGTSANRLTNPASTINGIDGDGLGNTGGSETHQLTTAQMPSHTHDQTIRANANITGGGNPGVDRGITTNQTGSTGGDQAHNNVQPTIILNYIIKT
jgi:microcystin-dependent protein